MSRSRQNRKPQTILTWCLLIIVCLAALPLGANRPLSWIIFATFVLGLFMFQIILELTRSAENPMSGLFLPGTIFFALLAWTFAQTWPDIPEIMRHPNWSRLLAVQPQIDGSNTISGAPTLTANATLRFLSYGMVFWIAYRCALTSRNAEILIGGFAVFSTLLALYGLQALATSQNFIIGVQDSTLTASFVNRNHYATYAGFGVLANLAAYFQFFRRNEVNRNEKPSFIRDLLERFFEGAWVFAMGAFICLIALVLTQSRAGNIAAFIGVFVFIWMLNRNASRVARALVWITAISVIALLMYSVSSGLLERLFDPKGEIYRPELYRATLEGIMQRPYFGHGFGAYEDLIRPYLPIDVAFAEAGYAHNTYLEVAFGLGIPAACALYLMHLILMVKPMISLKYARRNRAFIMLTIAAYVLAAMHSLVEFSLQIPAVALIFSVLLGVGWAQASVVERSQRD